MGKRYHYLESGLRNVWLVNGYAIHQTAYGQGVSIHDVEGLHRVIARALVAKPGHLTGTEVRFLRKELGMSQASLGSLLGVTDQSVALWERGKGRIQRAADRLLRLIFTERDRGNAPVLAFIEQLNNLDAHEPEEIVARESATGWETRLAA